VGEKLSATGPGSSAGAADGDAEMVDPGTVDPGYEPVTRLRSDDAAEPPAHPSTDARFALPQDELVTRLRFDDAAGSPAHPVTDARFALPKGARAPSQPGTQTALPRLPPPDVPNRPRMVAAPEDLVRYGPGVPPAPPGVRVEPSAARASHGGPPAPAHRRARVRRVLGAALAVILLAASGVVFYLRFHHPPLQVTSVAIVGSGSAACAVAVAGQIGTNGASGVITYQWLFPAGTPLTRHQSVSAGQHSVNVQVTVEGNGHGMASQRVLLQVLHPGQLAALQNIVVRCQ
jgi:hypothetical protein